MEGSTALFLGGFERVEGIKVLARKHHRGAMRNASQYGKNHAKAMIQGHRYAQPFPWTQVHRRARKITVIQNITVRQGCAFRVTCCAAGKLDINRIIGSQFRG